METRIRALAALSLAAITTLGGCFDTGEDSDTGTVGVSLVGHGMSGAVYRLRDATITVSGASPTVVWNTEDDPDRTSLSADVNIGDYSAVLAPGWRLERIVMGQPPVDVVAQLLSPNPAAFTVERDLSPRFRDTDAMGHINNAVYVTYLEVARQAYWQELDAESDYRRVPFILAGVKIDFRSEALVKETLRLAVRCAWIGGKSFGFEYEIREKASGRLVVEASSVQVCYDYEAKRSIEVPESLRRRLESFEGRDLTRKTPA